MIPYYSVYISSLEWLESDTDHVTARNTLSDLYVTSTPVIKYTDTNTACSFKTSRCSTVYLLNKYNTKQDMHQKNKQRNTIPS